MTKYTGLAPAAALQLWGQTRAALAKKYGIDLANPNSPATQQALQSMTPDDAAEFTAVNLQQQNPAAWQLQKTGADDPTNKNQLQVFNPNSGDFEAQQKQGYFSHPESWLQLALGGGLAGAGAAGLLPGALGSTAGGATPSLIDYGGGTLIPAAASSGASSAPGVGAAIGGALLDPRALSTGLGVFGTLFGTKLQNDAAQAAADKQSEAVKYSADLQDAATKRAEAFARAQAENLYQNSEVTRRGNYDQWAAREGRISSLGAALGLGQRNIPAYAAGVDPRYTADATATSGAAPAPVNLDLSQYGSDPVAQAVAKNYAALGQTPTGPGTGPTDLQYFAQRIAQTGGLTPDNTAYWFGPNGRIAKELAGGVPPEPTSNAPTVARTQYLPGSLGQGLTTQFWWS